MVRAIEDDTAKRNAMEMLAIKYAPESTQENRAAAIQCNWAPLCMPEMFMEHMSGKEAFKLVRAKNPSKN